MTALTSKASDALNSIGAGLKQRGYRNVEITPGGIGFVDGVYVGVKAAVKYDEVVIVGPALVRRSIDDQQAIVDEVDEFYRKRSGRRV